MHRNPYGSILTIILHSNGNLLMNFRALHYIFISALISRQSPRGPPDIGISGRILSIISIQIIKLLLQSDHDALQKQKVASSQAIEASIDFCVVVLANEVRESGEAIKSCWIATSTLF